MSKIITICYGKKDEWDTREEAEKYFFDAMMGCDPESSEYERYANIYDELVIGYNVCTDEV